MMQQSLILLALTVALTVPMGDLQTVSQCIEPRKRPTEAFRNGSVNDSFSSCDKGDILHREDERALALGILCKSSFHAAI